MKCPPEMPIPEKEWGATPLSVQAVVIGLWSENQILKEQVGRLQKQVDHLQAEVAKLCEQVNKNSKNSSKPPSSDPPYQGRYPKQPPSGQKKGGQEGHPGKGRKLKGPEQVDRIVVSRAVACEDCRALLLGEDPHPRRHPVTELPKVEPIVTEYQLHSLTCCVCGARNQAEWPADMPKGSFGERMQATVGYLSGRFGLSKRDIEEALETIYQVEISLGSIPAQEQAVSQALAKAVSEALDYVQAQASVNMDETSWRELTKLVWMWVCTTPAVTVVRIFSTRGASGAEQLLGEDYPGIVGSDRYSAYNGLSPDQRQLCWSHLKRDFQAWVERGGHSQLIGRALLEQIKIFFALWHRIRDGTLSRTDFQTSMLPVRREVHAILTVGTFVQHSQTRRTCCNILKVEQALWTFVDHEGVEPTNHAAERALRRGVIWRRRSFGTQSQAGSRFAERILTVVSTLRQQQRSVLDYLTEACHARTLGISPPSLLPAMLRT